MLLKRILAATLAAAIAFAPTLSSAASGFSSSRSSSSSVSKSYSSPSKSYSTPSRSSSYSYSPSKSSSSSSYSYTAPKKSSDSYSGFSGSRSRDSSSSASSSKKASSYVGTAGAVAGATALGTMLYQSHTANESAKAMAATQESAKPQPKATVVTESTPRTETARSAPVERIAKQSETTKPREPQTSSGSSDNFLTGVVVGSVLQGMSNNSKASEPTPSATATASTAPTTAVTPNEPSAAKPQEVLQTSASWATFGAMVMVLGFIVFFIWANRPTATTSRVSKTAAPRPRYSLKD